eukprot:PhM_4_TR11016/c0_g1_i1/m.27864
MTSPMTMPPMCGTPNFGPLTPPTSASVPDPFGIDAMAYKLNLAYLQSVDPMVEEVLHSCAHVVLYEYDVEKESWIDTRVHGSLHLVSTWTGGRKFVLLNRVNRHPLPNYVVTLTDATGTSSRVEWNVPEPGQLMYRVSEDAEGEDGDTGVSSLRGLLDGGVQPPTASSISSSSSSGSICLLWFLRQSDFARVKRLQRIRD